MGGAGRRRGIIERELSATVPFKSLLASPDIAHLARMLADRPGRVIESPDARHAAIALVLRASATGSPELLLIRRAEFEGDPWSGHIACPGGRREPGDRSLEHTAIRETWEETGIDIARDGQILGALDDMTPTTKRLPPLIIRPFVAVVTPAVQPVASDEVAEAFWVPLAAMRERERWGRGLVDIAGLGEREVDVFTHDEYVVWGLTHRALSQFLEYLG
jgi:8-oxo-dGTP pyrophosphatase MutT (NUDIX family)